MTTRKTRHVVRLSILGMIGSGLVNSLSARPRRGVSFQSFDEGQHAQFLADYQPLRPGKPAPTNLVRCVLSVHELKRQGQAVDWRPEDVFTADPGAVKAFHAMESVLKGRFDDVAAIQQNVEASGDEWLSLAKIVDKTAARAQPPAPAYADLATVLRFMPVTAARSAPEGVLTQALQAYTGARSLLQKALRSLLTTLSSRHAFSPVINPQASLRIKLKREASQGKLKDPALVALLTVMTTNTGQRLQLAMQFSAHGQKEAAAVCARTAVEAAPDDPAVVREAAAVLIRANQPEDVYNLYRKGEETLPYPGKRLVRIDLLRWLRSYDERERRGRLQEERPAGLPTVDEELQRRTEAAQTAKGFDATLALADAQWMHGEEAAAGESYQQAWKLAKTDPERWCAWSGMAEIDPAEAWRRFIAHPIDRKETKLAPDDFYTALLVVGTAAGEFASTAETVAAGLAGESQTSSDSAGSARPRSSPGYRRPPPTGLRRTPPPGYVRRLPPGSGGALGTRNPSPEELARRREHLRRRYSAGSAASRTTARRSLAGEEAVWGWVAALELLSTDRAEAMKALTKKPHRNPELTVAALYAVASGRAPAHTKALSARLSGRATMRLATEAKKGTLWTAATQAVAERAATVDSTSLVMSFWSQAMTTVPDVMGDEARSAAKALTAAVVERVAAKAADADEVMHSLSQVGRVLESKRISVQWPYVQEAFLGLLRAARLQRADAANLDAAVRDLLERMARAGLGEEEQAELRQAAGAS